VAEQDARRVPGQVGDLGDGLAGAQQPADGALAQPAELQVAKEANKLNDTVRSLTAWAAILVVPTLIASIYGMNFERMPELRWHFGYGFALTLMVGSSVALWVSFKRRGWL
jgi:magnesium transporter